MEIHMLKFELTLEEANMVLAALGKAPFEAVAGLINKLQQQAQPQIAALEAASKANAASPNVVTDV